jgi:ABC-type sulfate/molybdate transport systems ATPase subunit
MRAKDVVISTRSADCRKIYIAVMGVTGAGKSTFIRIASGLEGVDVGHDLKSCECWGKGGGGNIFSSG